MYTINSAIFFVSFSKLIFLQQNIRPCFVFRIFLCALMFIFIFAAFRTNAPVSIYYYGKMKAREYCVYFRIHYFSFNVIIKYINCYQNRKQNSIVVSRVCKTHQSIHSQFVRVEYLGTELFPYVDGNTIGIKFNNSRKKKKLRDINKIIEI